MPKAVNVLPGSDELPETLAADLPALVFVSGPAGAGKRRAALATARGLAVVYVPAPGLPDDDTRRLVQRELDDLPSIPGGAAWDRASWSDLLDALLAAQPVVLVLDGLGALIDANRRLLDELGQFWNGVVESDAQVAVVLIDEDQSLGERVLGGGSPFRDPRATLLPERRGPPGLHVRAVARPFDYWARRCPGWSAEDVIRAACIFGGLEPAISAVDPGLRLATNVRRAILSPGGPLFDFPLRHLRERFQSLARYGAIVRAVAEGAETWRSIGDRLGESGSGASLAPYLHRLRDLGMVEVRRALDAKPNARRRRYRLLDPFPAFWWAVVPDLRAGLFTGRIGADEAWAVIQPRLEAHVERELPRIVEQYLSRHAVDRLGAIAREVGGLWGDGYDIPAAATLRSGAVVYGVTRWRGRLEESDLDSLEADMRRTRYGFGREARVRLLFSAGGFSDTLTQRGRRDPLVRFLTPAQLVADARRGTPPD